MVQNTQHEVLDIIAGKSVAKSQMTLGKQIVMGILGGFFVSIGYLAYIRVYAVDNSYFLAASVFPVGLIFVLLAGADLATGNMLVMAVGVYLKRITPLQLVKNWTVILLTNLIGSLIAAFIFGHYVGLTDAFAEKVFVTANAKIGDSFDVALLSGILCNIFVCLAVWLSFTAKDFAGKFLAIWFVITVFVLSGTQHVVANMFIIPAAMFAGADITLTAFAQNLLAVAIGNAIGGGVIVGLIYTWIYKEK